MKWAIKLCLICFSNNQSCSQEFIFSFFQFFGFNLSYADPPPDHEQPWQQLMLFNYVIHEAIDAMARERAAGRHTPLNQSWQQFVHHLRRQKPTLGLCLDSLLQQAGRPL